MTMKSLSYLFNNYWQAEQSERKKLVIQHTTPAATAAFCMTQGKWNFIHVCRWIFWCTYHRYVPTNFGVLSSSPLGHERQISQGRSQCIKLGRGVVSVATEGVGGTWVQPWNSWIASCKDSGSLLSPPYLLGQSTTCLTSCIHLRYLHVPGLTRPGI